ncbi:hypothetical protein SOVF_210630, partial [Spinacia oleracea]
IISSLERKILVTGCLEPEASQQPDAFSGVQSLQVKAKKPSWKIGSPFSIKASNGLPKVQITDNMDLIDEDTLLTEDLKKPLRRILLVGTVKLEAQGKPARTVLRAEEEQKVENFGVNNVTAGYSSVCVWQRMCYNVYKL